MRLYIKIFNHLIFLDHIYILILFYFLIYLIYKLSFSKGNHYFFLSKKTIIFIYY